MKNSEKIFFDGDHYFKELLEEIDLAKESITVEMYMFNPDSIGRIIANKLIQAQNRGVRVQLIVDGVGSYHFHKTLETELKNHKIQVKIYHPLPFYHPYYGPLRWWRKFGILLSRILRINTRNHRKLITIDQKVLFAGSFNFTEEHTDFMKERKWKDMGMRITGSVVPFAVLNFKKIWNFKEYFRYKKQIKKTTRIHWKTSPLRLNNTLFMKRFFYKDFLHRINQAENQIWFMTPYFIPKRRLIKALGKAAERGVDIKLLISRKTDVSFFNWLPFFYFPFLVKRGVNIFLYKESVLHAKNYIIDDFITIGSTNLNHRSFLHDLEFDLQVQDLENKALVKQHFLETLHGQIQVNQDYLNKRSLKDRLISRILFTFKYWF